MKKIFAVLAAAAVAASTLAFTGCGKTAAENTPQEPDSAYTPDSGSEQDAPPQGNITEVEMPPVEDGEIEGNYREVTALQAASVLSGINANKLKEFSGLGLKTGISGSASAGDIVSAGGSLILDYKLGLSEDGIAGAGTASIKADYSHRDYPDKAVSVDLTGSIYNDFGFVYASAAGNVAGKVLTGDEKIKINLLEISEALNESETPSSPALGFDMGSFLNIANLIANSSAFGVKIYVDTDDGIKFKLSATEQTVWAAVAAAGSGTTVDFEAIEDGVLINSFKFDVYFAIDGNGAFSRASVVSDIDVTVDLGALGISTAEGGEELPAFTVSVKGFSMIYAFEDEVILPDSVTGGYYVDLTETVLDLFKNNQET